MLQQIELLPTTVHKDYSLYEEDYNHYESNQGNLTLEDYSLIREIVDNNEMEDYEDLYHKYIDPKVIEYPKFVCKQEKTTKYLKSLSKQKITKTEALVFTLLRDREDFSVENVNESKTISLKTLCLSDHFLLAEIFFITDLEKYCSMTEGLEHIFNRSNC